jgi:N-acyl-D-aspartate/D-glutamate deacylase
LDYDFVIKNGHIIDGTGNSWYKADIGIKEGRIATLSRRPVKTTGRSIDAENLVVCPGFINVHSHSDWDIFGHNNAENCLGMGLVTELTGQCGGSPAPINEEYKETVKSSMKRRLSPDIEVDWRTLSEWMKKVERNGLGINIAPLAGHGTIRACAMGTEGNGGERVVPTRNEMKEMKVMLDGAMKDGAFGLSTGLNYAPGRNALKKEVVELCKVVNKYGGLYSSHIRCEGDRLIQATEEFLDICESAAVRGTISHHKASGRSNYGKVNETIRMVEKARKKGVDIIIDLYPWRFGGTTKSLGDRFAGFLSGDLPGKTPREELVEHLKDDTEWKRLKTAAYEAVEHEKALFIERKKSLEENGGWTSTPYALQQSGTIISSRSHSELNGNTLEQVAEFFGEKDILDGIRALLVADEGYTVAGGEPYSEEDIVTILKYPWTVVSTDQFANDDSKVSYQKSADHLKILNPRGLGTYPKILGKYVREEKVITLEGAIRKMTSLPAQFLGLPDRGLVKEGFWADLVVFDAEKVKSNATYGAPQVYPSGIPYVLVNGELAVDKGKLTGVLAGKVLRNNT